LEKASEDHLQEYADALNSVVTAYYTEPELIRRINNAFENFGFTGGEVPSQASGLLQVIFLSKITYVGF